MKRKTWVVSGLALAAVAGIAVFSLRRGKEQIHWRTAKVDKGSITQRITATGTVNALIQVPVGTQVSGVVTALYADFNSLVKKGQVIGQIDPTPWLTNLKDAQAGLQRAEATLANAQSDFRRNQALWENKLLSAADLEAKDLALKVAQGNLESARAALAKAQTDLGYCTIKAPVDGVVVARLVDVGQTVAASFSTPNVFTIAQDLSRMKVQAAIDEADIGQVRVGQRAFFTVDSYPEKQFRGQVSEVQLNPVVTNNVVTYNVVMEVANEPRSPGEGGGQQAAAGPRSGQGLEYTTARYIPAGSPVYRGELALFPGMTANCTVVTNRKDDTLRVPSAALRFNPAAFTGMPEKKAAAAPAGQRPSPAAGRGMAARREDRLWVLANGQPKALAVQAGVSDGSFTEVSGEGIAEGLEVLTGVEELKKTQNQGSPLGGGMRH